MFQIKAFPDFGRHETAGNKNTGLWGYKREKIHTHTHTHTHTGEIYVSSGQAAKLVEE